MNVVEMSTGKLLPIDILPVEKADFKTLHKDRYFFDWKEEKSHELYKLVIRGQNDILGLISLETIPSEWRIHIRLLTVSKENKGRGKVFEKITGNLITHAAKLAVLEFAELACVSLRPKSSIAQHYIAKYNMSITGMTLSIEVPKILDLINQYDNDK